MAITFPISANNFFKALPITDMTFTLTDQRSTSETRRGEIIVSDSGARLWEGMITLDTDESEEVERFLAVAEILGDPAASFFAVPLHNTHLFPGSSPTLAAVRNGNELKVGGLNNGQVIVPGSYLSFQYGANPTRHALHKIVSFSEETVGTSGETTYLRVIPDVAPGYSIGSAVKLANPECKAIMVPGSLSAPAFSGIRGGSWSFRWRQTNR